MVTADELIKDQIQRENKRKKFFKKIYKLVEKRIIDVSKFNLNQCYYDVPYFVLNIPLYSMDNCINYIIEKLINNGFKVELFNKNRIYINWDK
jgi:hypothetical protein